MREWLKEIFSFCAVENRLRVCLLSAIPPHRPTKRHFFLESMALIFAAAVLLLSACGEPTEKPAQISASQASGSIQFERVPGDKLDPVLKRYQTPPWNLKKMPEFKNAFDVALSGKDVEKWVRDIHVVAGPGAGTGEAYHTPDGVAFVYYGTKVHEADTKAVFIAFLPASKLVRIRVDEKCRETKFFGSPNASLAKLLPGAGESVFQCDTSVNKERH